MSGEVRLERFLAVVRRRRSEEYPSAKTNRAAENSTTAGPDETSM